MENASLGLHHPVVIADDLDALTERYRAMGFALAGKDHHPWGTAVQRAVFPDGGIALLGIDDTSLLDEPTEAGVRLGRFIANQLNRREGIGMLALNSADAAADAAAIAARGLEPDGVVTLPGAATLAVLLDWDEPQLSFVLR